MQINVPAILEWTNLSREGSCIQPFDVIRMRGIHLKTDPLAMDEGIFWTDETGQVVSTPVITLNNPTEVHFQVPPLNPGFYRVTLTARIFAKRPESVSLEETVKIKHPPKTTV